MRVFLGVRLGARRRRAASVAAVACVGFLLSARVALAQQPALVAPWDQPAACVPGSVSRCVCGGGAPGLRRCLGVGASFGPCQCDAPRGQISDETAPHADREASTPDGDGPRAERRWYGWQFLLVDGASLVLGVSSLGTGSIVQFGFASAGFSFGGPIVHWAHGHVGRGFGSLGLRVGLPLTALGISVAASRTYTSLLLLLVLIPSSIAAAITVDAAVLAYDERAPTSHARGLAWAPTLDVRPEGATLGVAGSF